MFKNVLRRKTISVDYKEIPLLFLNYLINQNPNDISSISRMMTIVRDYADRQPSPDDAIVNIFRNPKAVVRMPVRKNKSHDHIKPEIGIDEPGYSWKGSWGKQIHDAQYDYLYDYRQMPLSEFCKTKKHCKQLSDMYSEEQIQAYLNNPSSVVRYSAPAAEIGITDSDFHIFTGNYESGDYYEFTAADFKNQFQDNEFMMDIFDDLMNAMKEEAQTKSIPFNIQEILIRIDNRGCETCFQSAQEWDWYTGKSLPVEEFTPRYN